MKDNRAKTGFLCMALVSCVIIGCQESATPPNPSAAATKPLVTLTAQQEAQKEIAVDSRDKLFAALTSEMMAALVENGPSKSIKVCKLRAPELTKLASMQPSVKIGRTSFQLRNPENKPPIWAASFVADRIEADTFVELPNQTLGALLPIRLKITCVLCHGNEEQVASEVKAAIVSNYPDDQATGFAEGDLRGYFWAEVAAPSKESNAAPSEEFDDEKYDSESN